MTRDTPPARLAADLGGQTLCAAVEAALGRTYETTVDDLRLAARHLADHPTPVASWLAALSQDSVCVTELARRSYWHPNGFAKLVLHVNRSPEFRIRLHVWPQLSGGALLGESNPHSHRWDFASTILAGGGLHMVEYMETSNGGRPYDRYRYGVDPADPAALSRAGGASLKRIGTAHVGVGDVYSCDTRVVHTVAPIRAGLTATLVVQGPHRSPTTVVYCTPGRDADQPNRALSESDFALLVKSVSAEMVERAAR